MSIALEIRPSVFRFLRGNSDAKSMGSVRVGSGSDGFTGGFATEANAQFSSSLEGVVTDPDGRRGSGARP